MGAFAVLATAGVAVAGAASVSGDVFRDYNDNGTRNAGSRNTAADSGVAGVTVTATTGSASAAATTDGDGHYTLSLPDGSGTARIRFSDLPSGWYDGRHGTDSKTSVQFVDIGSSPVTGASLGLSAAGEYGPDAPRIVVPEQSAGEYNGTNAANPSIWRLDYSGSNVKSLATFGDTGSVLGVAYNGKDSIFASAFMKRGSGFGPGGPGAIYRVAADGSGVDLFATIPNAGEDPHENGTFPQDHDDAGTIWNGVGRTSLGGLAISNDHKTLYSLNLNDRKLYQVAINGTSGTPDGGTAVPPAPGCAADDSRPGGLGVGPDGKVYVGVTCTNASTDDNASANFASYVFALNPTSGDFGSTPDVTIPMTPSAWPRKCAHTFGGPDNTSPNDITNTTCSAKNRAEWNSWVDQAELPAPGTDYMQQEFFGQTHHPQPWISQISFNGTRMRVGFRDLWTDKIGWNLQDPRSQYSGNYWYSAGAGDTVAACADTQGGALELESNGTCGEDTSAGAGGNEGLGGGNFYVGAQTNGHDHLGEGGILHVPGFSSTVSNAYDSIFGEVYTQGVIWMDEATGRRVNLEANVTAGPDAPSYVSVPASGTGVRLSLENSPPGAFGKANGLGDIAALIGEAPIEIGNRVWKDTNKDGVQDPGEAPIPGVTIELHGADGSTLCTTTTAADGTYYFGNGTGGSCQEIQPTTSYTVCIPGGQTPLSGLQPTTATAGSDREVDSNGQTVGACDSADVTTGQPGENNHSIDFGFVEPTPPPENPPPNTPPPNNPPPNNPPPNNPPPNNPPPTCPPGTTPPPGMTTPPGPGSEGCCPKTPPTGGNTPHECCPKTPPKGGNTPHECCPKTPPKGGNMPHECCPKTPPKGGKVPSGCPAPRLGLTKAANRKTVRGGGSVTFALTVRNRGTAAAQKVVVCDRVPTGLAFQKAMGGKGTLVKGRVCFQIGTLKPGASKTVRVQTRAVRCISRSVRNTATATSPSAAKATASRNVSVRRGAGCFPRPGVTG